MKERKKYTRITRTRVPMFAEGDPIVVILSRPVVNAEKLNPYSLTRIQSSSQPSVHVFVSCG